MNKRFVSIYYRDEAGVMRKIPGIELMITKTGSRVYTLGTVITREIRLNEPKLTGAM